VLIDCLDLDAVTRARTHGTFGLNKPWVQLARHGADLRLPIYDGAGIQTPPWHRADQAGADCLPRTSLPGRAEVGTPFSAMTSPETIVAT